MKKTVKVLGLAALVLAMNACASLEMGKSKEKDYELVLVHVNDVHGRVTEKVGGMGYVKMATLMDNLRADKNNKEVMFLDAGDSLHGSTFATLERGESVAKVLDKLGLKAMTLGNHDFNYGSDRTKELNEKTKFDMLASNVTENGKPFTKEYIIETVNGKKVGIFGLATPETMTKTNPKNVEKIKFNDPIPVAKDIVARLKAEKVDFIIVLSHLGLDAATESHWRSDALAKEVPGINLIIDGHSHTVLSEKMVVNGASIVSTGEYGNNLGVTKIDFDELAKGPDAITYELIAKEKVLEQKDKEGKVTSAALPDHKEVGEYVKSIQDGQKAITDVVLATTPVKLVGDRDIVRTGPTNLSNLIADAMVWKSNADVSITNGGGIRASIEAGNITVGNIVTVLPFGNYVITKELTGKDIKDALEHGLKDMPNSAGSMAQFGGLSLVVDLTKPAGQRVSDIKLNNGKKFSETDKYIVASNDFMANGGDGYVMFKGKKDIANFPALDEVTAEYIKTTGKVPATADGRLTVKK